MSVLELPRLHFTGLTTWNPDTVNNSSDIYNEVTAEPVPQSGVAWDQYVSWLKQSNNQRPPSPNGSWNVYGDQGVQFSGATVNSVDVAGAVSGTDNIVGAAVNLYGRNNPDPTQPATGPARLIDVEPYGPFTSQIFFERVVVGDDQLGVEGPGVCRMFSRWPNFARNMNDNHALIIAGSMGVIWQTAIRKEDLQWYGLGGSNALDQLHQAMQNDLARGIVIQFASYATEYYKLASYQGKPIQNGQDLIDAYAAGFTGGNPARSALIGTIGVWGADELASGPTDRLLVAAAPVPLLTPTMSSLMTTDDARGDARPAVPGRAATTWSLGAASARVIEDRSVVAVNFVATFPETNDSLTKADFGSFTLRAKHPSGKIVTFEPPLTYSQPNTPQYNETAYLAGGGILEFPFNPDDFETIRDAALELICDATGEAALTQYPQVVETDQRGLYVDEGETGAITLRLYENGAPSTGPAKVLVAQYDNNLNLAPGQFVQLLADPGTPLAEGVVEFSGGVATFFVQPVSPGVCYLGFFPFASATPPKSPAALDPTVSSTFFSSIRVLPFDNQLEATTSDQELTFDFIYQNVLMTYDLIYPLMSLIFNLESSSAVDANSARIMFRTALEEFPSTVYMPITRELSAGKRKLLWRYFGLQGQ